MHLVASVCPSVRPSVRPSVCPFVCALTAEELLPVRGVCLCVCYQGAYTDNSAYAVDRRFNWNLSFG